MEINFGDFGCLGCGGRGGWGGCGCGGCLNCGSRIDKLSVFVFDVDDLEVFLVLV